MILGIDELLRLVREKELVKHLSEREIQRPEGAGFDIRVGEIYEIEGEGFLGVEKRKTPTPKLVAQYGKDKEYILKPGAYVLVRTIEEVNIPENLVMLTFPRSTLQRCGILLLATQTAPGYSGKLVFGMKNLGPCPFRMELGARIAHVIFLEVKGKTSLYRGQWKGGRVATPELERQV